MRPSSLSHPDSPFFQRCWTGHQAQSRQHPQPPLGLGQTSGSSWVNQIFFPGSSGTWVGEKESVSWGNRAAMSCVVTAQAITDQSQTQRRKSLQTEGQTRNSTAVQKSGTLTFSACGVMPFPFLRPEGVATE